MVIAYLLYSKKTLDIRACTELFNLKRATSKGINVPSQLRYLGYYDRYLQGLRGKAPKGIPTHIIGQFPFRH
jgi:hypothetical protein